MSFFQGLQKALGFTPDGDLEEMDSDGMELNTPETQAYSAEERPGAASSGRRTSKVVNVSATTQLRVVLVTPEQYDEAASIADHLREKRTVVLNLENANKEASRRLLDFLSGAIYINNGQIKRIANSTYIITPVNVDIMGDLLDELENNGVYI